MKVFTNEKTAYLTSWNPYPIHSHKQDKPRNESENEHWGATGTGLSSSGIWNVQFSSIEPLPLFWPGVKSYKAPSGFLIGSP